MNKTSSLYKVVITDADDYTSFQNEKDELEGIAEITAIGHCKTEEDVIKIAKEAHGIINNYAPITKKVISSLKNLKVITTYGVGLNCIDVEAATLFGIYVLNVPTYGIDEVSDHALALILACIRKVVQLNNLVKNGIWDFKSAGPIFRIKGKILGIVGFGHIGRRIAKKAHSFGLKVISYDPYVQLNVMKKYNVKKTSLKALLKQSDVVSLNTPLTKETKHLIGESEFKLMKANAYLINMCRGEVINQKDLYKALKEKWISGAAIDVAEGEPLDKNSNLLELDNLIITPHVGWYSIESNELLKREVAKNIAMILKGEKPKNIVNRDVL